MLILHLISSYGFFGAENLVLNLNLYISSLNNEIDSYILVFKNSQNPHIELAEYASKHGIKSFIIDCKGRFDYSFLSKLVILIKSNKINILHSHGYKSNFYGFLASKICNIPIISTCHNWIAKDLRTRFYYKIDKFLLPRFDKIIAVSDEIKQELLRIGTNPEKVCLIHNGINTKSFSNILSNIKADFNLNPDSLIIGSVARFTEEKGLENILYVAKKILKENKNIYFMLVGDGPLKNSLIQKSKELQIYDHMIFTGQRSDMPEVYNTFDIFVLPSLKEGLPMVILEAMASKKPIVASSVGAIPDVIEDGKSGLLVPPGNINSLYQALKQLINNPSLRNYLGENAFERVKNNFSTEKMCDEYIKIYNEVLENHNK